MGNEHSKTRLFHLRPDEESLAEPGKRCIVGDFSKLDPPMNLDEIFDAMQLYGRYPVLEGTDRHKFLKHVEVEEHGPLNYTTKVTLDGSKLDAAGQGKGDGTDKIVRWTTSSLSSLSVGIMGASKRQRRMSSTHVHYVDAKEGAWANEVVASALEAEIVGQTTCYEMPGRLEFCVNMGSGRGVRDASESMAQALYIAADGLGHFIATSRQAQVKVACGVESLMEPGRKCNLSEALGAIITYEKLFHEFLESIQAIGVQRMLESSATGFVGDAWRPELNASWIRCDCQHSIETGEIKTLQVAISEAGIPLRQPWSRLTKYVVHPEPLCVESWIVDDEGYTIASKVDAFRLQVMLNDVVETANHQTPSPQPPS